MAATKSRNWASTPTWRFVPSILILHYYKDITAEKQLELKSITADAFCALYVDMRD